MDDALLQLRDLASDYPVEPIRLNDFARLLGLDESGAAQLRAARKPPTASDPSQLRWKQFPETIAENGRTFAHRLGELVDWIDETGWLQAGRGGRRVDTEGAVREIAVWRLGKVLRDEAGAVGSGIEGARVAVAEIVTRGASNRLPQHVVSVLLDSLRRPGVVEQVLTDFGNAQPGTPNRTSTDVALLTALVLDPHEGAAVHDATCGECEVLLQLARVAKVWGEPLGRVTGFDVDADSMKIGSARLKLAGVEAEIGEQPPAGSVDCLVLDPGWDAPLHTFGNWQRLLRSNGRVALITRIRGTEAPLMASLPPSKVIFPPQRSTKEGALAIWLSSPLEDSKPTCDIVDFRRETTRPADPAMKVHWLNESLKPHRRVELTGDRDWDDLLGSLAPARAASETVALDELPARLSAVVGGSLGFPPDVIESNREYAVRLAQELRRLIDPDDDADQPTSGGVIVRPDESPAGVLAGMTTTEAKRVMERLLNSLSPGRPRSRTF